MSVKVTTATGTVYYFDETHVPPAEGPMTEQSSPVVEPDRKPRKKK